MTFCRKSLVCLMCHMYTHKAHVFARPNKQDFSICIRPFQRAIKDLQATYTNVSMLKTICPKIQEKKSKSAGQTTITPFKIVFFHFQFELWTKTYRMRCLRASRSKMRLLYVFLKCTYFWHFWTLNFGVFGVLTKETIISLILWEKNESTPRKFWHI